MKSRIENLPYELQRCASNIEVSLSVVDQAIAFLEGMVAVSKTEGTGRHLTSRQCAKRLLEQAKSEAEGLALRTSRAEARHFDLEERLHKEETAKRKASKARK